MLTLRTLAIATLITVLFAVDVMSHCHDTFKCEKLDVYMVSRERWDKPDRNRVPYYVNNSFGSWLPSLYPDILDGAEAWTDIISHGNLVDFGLVFEDDTHLHPNDEDEQNTVGWGYLGAHDNPKAPIAAVWPYYSNTNPRELVEQDMVFNYYKEFANHRDQNHNKYCLLQIATHEFGHFVRLKDMPSEQNLPVPVPRLL